MAHRFRVRSGPPTDPVSPNSTTPITTPTAGGPVDRIEGGVRPADGSVGYQCGHVFRMDTGGAFSAADNLATDGQGRAVLAGTGDVVVAQALEGSSGAGDVAWCAWDRRQL